MKITVSTKYSTKKEATLFEFNGQLNACFRVTQ